MHYYDVLLSACWVEGGDDSWYFVNTVKARTPSAAREEAKRKLRSFFKKQGRTLLYVNHHGTGAAGTYSNFVGKRVGQFIDEAFAKR